MQVSLGRDNDDGEFRKGSSPESLIQVCHDVGIEPKLSVSASTY